MINTLHIGTVIKNADFANKDAGQYLGRVKVVIPGMTIVGSDIINYKTPGSNIGGDLNAGAIKKANDFEIWAYVVAPITGESSASKYNYTKDASSLADGNDMSNFTHPTNYTTAPAAMFASQNLDGYSGGPSYNMTANVNPYGNCYVTENYSDSGKGMYSMPAVGSKVLIGFINGARGLPIVLGKINSGTEIEQIYGVGTAYPDYPNIFENTKAPTTTPPTSTTPTSSAAPAATVGQCGPVTTANARSKVQQANSLQARMDTILSQIQSPSLDAESKLSLSRQHDVLSSQRSEVMKCVYSLQGQTDTSVTNTGLNAYSPARIDVLKEVK